MKLLSGVFVFVLSSLVSFVAVNTLAAPKAEAVRDTIYTCERYVNYDTRDMPDGGRYVTVEYGLIGNDSARARSGAFENGSEIDGPDDNCLYPEGFDGSTNPCSTLFELWWECDGTVNFNGDYYRTALFNGRNPTRVFLGTPIRQPLDQESYDTNPALFGADAADSTRGAAGITTEKIHPFAGNNDAGRAFINGSSVFCLGLQYKEFFCNKNALNGGPGGSPVAWAGYLNGPSDNAKESLNDFFESSLWQDADSTPSGNLVDPSAPSFNLKLEGVNTEDPWFSCMAIAPWNNGPAPSGIPGCYDDEPFRNSKTSLFITYYVPPPSDPTNNWPVLTASTPTCETPTITGHAYDLDNVFAQLKITVSVDGPFSAGGTVVPLTPVPFRANGPSDDLPVEIGKQHGYQFSVAGYRTDRARTFYIYAQGVDPDGSEPLFELAVQTVTLPPCDDGDDIVCDASFLSVTPASPLEQAEPFSLTVGYSYPRAHTARGTLRIYREGTAPPAASPLEYNESTIPNIRSETYSDGNGLSPIGVYVVEWTVRIGRRVEQCRGRIEVGAKPYLKVYGNDVRAGGRFDQTDTDPTVCGPMQPSSTPDNRQAIFTFAREQNAPISGGTGDNIFTGASAQLAAYTLGEIDRFFTAGLRGPRNNDPTQPGNNIPTPVHDLTFGNFNIANNIRTLHPTLNSTVLDEDKVEGFGGRYGKPGCIPNYYSTKTDSDPEGADGTTVSPAGSPLRINNGESIIRYYDGDVFIQSNIEFSDTTWANPSEIPSYTLVAKGNIYIGPNVSRLDGVYVAQPRSYASDGTPDEDSGKIYTCAPNASGPYPPTAIHANCNDKLMINGSFIAQQVKFLRTNGTLRQGQLDEMPTGQNIAEVFNFSPIHYLATPPENLRDSSASRYDFITSLPPNL